jgi:predicted TIM-barrel fold metal-dependent hydrolase
MAEMHRRTFIGTATLAATAASQALAGEQARRPAPFRIDCQSHLFCPEMLAIMAKRTADPVVETRNGERWVRMGDWNRRVLPNHSDVQAKLASMDQAAIRMTALSINDPGPEWFGAEGPAVARLANDYVAGIVRDHPTRFFGLCVLPLQDMKASLAELERCVERLGMKGVLLYTNLAGRFPDEPQYRPLFARCTALRLPILLHPALPVTASLVRDYEMISGLGNMFDNTIALARLIMSGIFDRYPELKLVCPHLGGTLPYIVGRLDHQMTVLRRGPRDLKRTPSEYLKMVHYDIVSPLALAMKFGYEFAGADHLLFSSDHPWVDPRLIIDRFDSLKLPARDQAMIYHENARTMFGLKG